MITVICDENVEKIGEMMCESLEFKGKPKYNDIQFVSTKGKEIKPCYSCGGCENKTFGRCVIRDDMDDILPSMAVSDIWIIITRVVWGNPCYQVKKILDKSALLGNRFYKVRKGELVKGVGNEISVKKVVFIGVYDETDDKVAKDFSYWANEMGNIMNLSRIIRIIKPDINKQNICELAKDILIE